MSSVLSVGLAITLFLLAMETLNFQGWNISPVHVALLRGISVATSQQWHTSNPRFSGPLCTPLYSAWRWVGDPCMLLPRLLPRLVAQGRKAGALHSLLGKLEVQRGCLALPPCTLPIFKVSAVSGCPLTSLQSYWYGWDQGHQWKSWYASFIWQNNSNKRDWEQKELVMASVLMLAGLQPDPRCRLEAELGKVCPAWCLAASGPGHSAGSHRASTSTGVHIIFLGLVPYVGGAQDVWDPRQSGATPMSLVLVVVHTSKPGLPFAP